MSTYLESSSKFALVMVINNQYPSVQTMVQMIKNETINKVIYSQNESTAYGIRTRATAVKGLRPWPLDERGINKSNNIL